MMVPHRLEEALSVLVSAFAERDDSESEASAAGPGASWFKLGAERSLESLKVREAARELDKFLSLLSRSGHVAERLGPFLNPERSRLLRRWCEAQVARGDVRLFGFLSALSNLEEHREVVLSLARERVAQGPLADGLACAALLDGSPGLRAGERARLRMEILLWEAGVRNVDVPEFGRFVWKSPDHFEEFVKRPSKGALRERVLAARTVELAARHFDTRSAGRLLDEVLRVLQPLLLHPEPLVSIPAARAVGVLSGHVDHLGAMLLDWLHGPARVLRGRALTALGSLPASRVRAIWAEFLAALDVEEGRSELLAAASAATPYLFFQARDLWDGLLAEVVSAGDEGARAALEMARSLSGIFSTDTQKDVVREPLRALRQLARDARPQTLGPERDWLTVLSLTDVLEDAERDPLNLEAGLENLVRHAADHVDAEADRRAARFATSLPLVFEQALSLAFDGPTLEERAAGWNALVGAARCLALRLWHPQVRARSLDGTFAPQSIAPTWERVARAPVEILDRIRATEAAPPQGGSEWREVAEIVALELAGYSLDACVEEAGLKELQGSQAHAICRFVTKLEGMNDSGAQPTEELQRALSALFWRLVDSTRGTALGAVDDVEWLGPFSAWWALVIEKPQMLIQLANALPMIRIEALERCASLAEELRQRLSLGPTPTLVHDAERMLKALFADKTELGEALLSLGRVLAQMSGASGRDPDLDEKSQRLVGAAGRVVTALSNPVRGLHLAADEAKNAPLSDAELKTSALVVRAIRGREMGLLDVWLASLGPAVSPLVEALIAGAVERTPPPPPSRQKLKAEMIEGYELVRPLGEGGVGKVWLVRKPGADRLFVLKIPKKEALEKASDSERQGLLASFVEEARALASLYHPNVANIIDRGVSGDVPFLVLELLIGADLLRYCQAKLLTLDELKPIVLDTCAGLAALHGAGLVHRDIKPANIWLRLPLEQGVSFSPEQHRSAPNMRPLSAVLIDFGMVRPMKVPADASGKFVAGTPGFIAPDQVLDPVELDGRADVYALAGTIYAVTTGRTFFDDIKNPRDRVFAHMQKDPLENPELLKDYPPALAKLMRAAVALDPKDRPHPLEFARAFEAASE